MSLEKKVLKVLYWVAYGVAVHNAAHHVYELRGTVFSSEGVYVGLFFLGLIGFTLLHLRGAIKLMKKVKEKVKGVVYAP